MTERPSTPTRTTAPGTIPRAPVTPEQVRRLEENRLKAKALREQADATRLASNATATAGQKRPYSSISRSNVPTDKRDASATAPGGGGGSASKGHGYTQAGGGEIRPAKKFEKYIEYDFSTMTDTKGGFLTSDDDPHNRALHAPAGAGRDEKPAHMTLAEWERHRLITALRAQRAGPFEPGMAVREQNKCGDCGSLDIDWTWADVFGCRVCAACKEKFAEKYSLLTKTEAREDYLLTDPELKDEDLLPRLERPNPHKASYASMQLFLRFQVEEYAFSAKKWGSAEALDAEFARREVEKKRRKDAKFRSKLADLKKRTRVEAYKRSRETARTGAATEAHFGDRIGGMEKHVHEWGMALEDPETGMSTKRCVECGMEVEELEF